MGLPDGWLEFTAAMCGWRRRASLFVRWRDRAQHDALRRASFNARPVTSASRLRGQSFPPWGRESRLQVRRYGLLRNSAARASARCFVNRLCGFGRCLTARGSTRSGRCPTRSPAKCWHQISINVAADSSSSSGPTRRDCLHRRGEADLPRRTFTLQCRLQQRASN
jgi:hypothetical protein